MIRRGLYNKDNKVNKRSNDETTEKEKRISKNRPDSQMTNDDLSWLAAIRAREDPILDA